MLRKWILRAKILLLVCIVGTTALAVYFNMEIFIFLREILLGTFFATFLYEEIIKFFMKKKKMKKKQKDNFQIVFTATQSEEGRRNF